jgi:phosphatidylinositol alpha-1,6-mannosyltransferase
VVLTGGVPWSDVPAYTDAGDVFAMPCRTRRLGLEPEAWGIVFLEAQACGLPVVVGDSGGAPETLLGRGEVVHGVTEVTAALIRMLAAPRERVRPAGLPNWAGTSRVLQGLLAP